MSKSKPTNAEGLTWPEWHAAAGGSASITAETRKTWRKAWKAGEDPTEHRAARSAAEAAHVEDWIESAKAHGGEGEPDHEVGDLQELIWSLWDEMTPAQRLAALAKHAGSHTLWGRP